MTGHRLENRGTPAATADHSFCYVETDIPEGMTLADWRRRNCPPPGARTPRRQVLRRLGLHRG